MSDWTHWHKPGSDGSELTDPPTCCTTRFQRLAEMRAQAAANAQDQAVHAERRRVILGAVSRLEAYAADARPMIIDPAARVVFDAAVARCLELLLAAGCICERIEVTRFGDAKPSYLPGMDARCGMHERQEATR